MSALTSNQQLTIARQHRGDGRQVPKAARQVVPAFLQKLYEMVNDPKNSDLIRWSEAGDSFYVLDHERFAREVLGRWFKHQNFSSFVRQLNMYGFHKIPHLQQGVLKSENETEFWNFAHANFRQDQPDLLCLIQRKKQAPQANEDLPTLEIRESNSPSQPSTATLPSGQVLDIHSILNGLTALKRHQTTLSSELNELKRSNQLLWQEAMVAREKHQKQQDTINRIVKFLAGIFGQNAQHKDDAVEGQPSRAVIRRRQPQLVIEDRPRQSGGKVEITEVIDEDSDMESPFHPVSSTSPQMPIIETPSAPSPSPSITSEAPSVADTISYSLTHDPSLSKVASIGTLHSAQSATQSQPQSKPPAPSPHSQPCAAPSPAESSISSAAQDRAMTRSPSAGHFDPNYANSLQSLLSQMTPAQMQQLLSSLAIGMPSDSLGHSTQITPYQPQPQFDYNQYASSPPSFPLISPHECDPSQDPNGDGLISFTPHPLDAPRIERQWRTTADIDRNVNALSSDIDHLLESFGLDPQMLEGSNNPAAGTGIDSMYTSGITEDANSVIDPSSLELEYPHPPPPGQLPDKDFDFDSLLHGFANDSEGGTEEMAATNLDNLVGMVPTPGTSTSAATTQFLHGGPTPVIDTSKPTSIAPSQTSFPGRMLPPLTSGKKRKSDAVDGLPALPQTAATSITPSLPDACPPTSISSASLGGLAVPLEIRNFTPSNVDSSMQSMFSVLNGGTPMTGMMGGPEAAVAQMAAAGVAGNPNKKRRRSK